jgi:acyl dehydratase
MDPQDNIFMKFDDIVVGQDLGTSVIYVTKSSIIDYAQSIEDYDPIYIDNEEAIRAGYDRVVAPAGFTIQYSAMKWATGQAKYIPQGSVHIRQVHRSFGIIMEGDCLHTSVSVGDKYERKGKYYLEHKIDIHNQHDQLVCSSRFITLFPDTVH